MMTKGIFLAGLVWFCAPHLLNTNATTPCQAACQIAAIEQVQPAAFHDRLAAMKVEFKENRQQAGQSDIRAAGEDVREVVQRYTDHLAASTIAGGKSER